MDDSRDDLRKLVGQHTKVVYEIVKTGRWDDLSDENRYIAQAIRQHMHLKHVHNTLEFADLREGEPYEVIVDGNPVSPMAHLSIHAGVAGQIEADPMVAAAFEKMVATGTSAHHAEHVLGASLGELVWAAGEGAEAFEKARARYQRDVKKIARDSVFRKKLVRQFPSDHSIFE